MQITFPEPAMFNLSINVRAVTGPGMMMASYCADPAIRPMLHGFRILPVGKVRREALLRRNRDHKTMADDWHDAPTAGHKDIFP